MATGPEKILGDISAMQTLIDNFPMSILDYIHVKQYTSIYDLILDLLAACGIDIRLIEEKIIEELYGVAVEITEDIRSTHARIEEMEWEEDQSEFFQKLEVATKAIIMGILSSIMTCSSIPLVPRKRFDDVAPEVYYEIPLKTIDYWNLLSLCPTSEEGYMYYDIRQKNSYYKLTQLKNETLQEFDKTYDYIPVGVYGEIDNEWHDMYKDSLTAQDMVVFQLDEKYAPSGLSEDLQINVSYYDEDIVSNVVLQTFGGAFKFDQPRPNVSGNGYLATFVGEELKDAIKKLKPGVYSANVVAAHGGTDDYNARLGGRRVAAMNWYASQYNSGVTFTYDNGGRDDTKDIAIVTIDSTDEKVTQTTITNERSFSTVIRKGQTKADDALMIHYRKIKGGSGRGFIRDVSLNGTEKSLIIGDKNPYVSYEHTKATKMYSEWEKGENYSWYKTAEKNFYGGKISQQGIRKETRVVPVYTYEYKSIKKSLVEGTATIMKYLPTTPDETYPLYVMIPNDEMKATDLYKAWDLNALIWYTSHKGSNSPMVEFNKMMWDTRWTAAQQGIERKTSKDWNQWINSKKCFGKGPGKSEFNVSAVTSLSAYTTNEDKVLYPIIQLKRGEEQNIFVNFPFQSFYDLDYAKANGGVREITEKSSLIYTYNWEYLKSIKIFKVRIILHRMLEELLGIKLSSPIKLSLEQKIKEAKLREIILNILEADDTEVSDCFNKFSNESYNEAIEEMLLQKYNASYYGSDTTVAQTRNVQDYLDAIDNISPFATAEGTTEKITKLVNDIVSTPGEEETYKYELKASYDLSLLKQLVMAIAMPIVECVFSPQLMLLIMINFQIMGIIPTTDITEGGQSAKIVNMLVNKMFAMLKELIYYLKDVIAEFLMKLFYETILPLLEKYIGLIVLERLRAWLKLLREALDCVTIFKLERSKVLMGIDNVNYADIVNDQDTPESSSEC